MRVVVCDTGPILHLREAGVLDFLLHGGEIFHLLPPKKVLVSLGELRSRGAVWHIEARLGRSLALPFGDNRQSSWKV